MKIDPAILGRHLHQAAIEQIAETLAREGYDVEYEPSLERAAQVRPDLVARRGDETIVYEVQVIGDNSRRDVENVARAARALKAQFRLVVVRPQRETAITVEGADDLVLHAAQSEEAVKDLRHRLAGIRHRLVRDPLAGIQVEAVTDVTLDSVSVSGDETELSGGAVALVSRPEGSFLGGSSSFDGEDIPFAFTIWFDGVGRMTQPARIIWDVSAGDDAADA